MQEYFVPKTKLCHCGTPGQHYGKIIKMINSEKASINITVKLYYLGYVYIMIQYADLM